MAALMALLLAAAAPAAAPTAACPADFRGFMARFQDDPAFQRARTARMVAMSRLDMEAEPEPRAVTRVVPRARVPFPVMPTRRAAAAEGLRLTVTGREGPAPTVILRGADDGRLVRFGFSRAGDCWKLHRVDDEST